MDKAHLWNSPFLNANHSTAKKNEKRINDGFAHTQTRVRTLKMLCDHNWMLKYININHHRHRHHHHRVLAIPIPGDYDCVCVCASVFRFVDYIFINQRLFFLASNPSHSPQNHTIPYMYTHTPHSHVYPNIYTPKINGDELKLSTFKQHTLSHQKTYVINAWWPLNSAHNAVVYMLMCTIFQTEQQQQQPPENNRRLSTSTATATAAAITTCTKEEEEEEKTFWIQSEIANNIVIYSISNCEKPRSWNNVDERKRNNNGKKSVAKYESLWERMADETEKNRKREGGRERERAQTNEQAHIKTQTHISV